MATSPLTIEINDLKALKSFKWTPSGVCALVGPNGSGKSTALRVFEVLRIALEDSMNVGLRLYGRGILKNFDAEPADVPRVSLATDKASWSVEVGAQQPLDETGQSNGAVLRRARAIATHVDIVQGGVSSILGTNDDLGLRMLRQTELLPELRALGEVIARSRYFQRADLARLRESGSPETDEISLDMFGRDLFTVLKNWKLNSDHEHRLEFVVESMRSLFPDFRNLDFPQAGQRVSGRSVGLKSKLEPTDWSDGFFSCLCLLTALASVEKAIVAFDEPETSLHPELIHHVVELMRDWSRDHDTTVILATHSPVVLDQFRAVPEQVFVMQPGLSTLPVQLDVLKKREWLEHFSLGDLYSHSEVGAPTP
jgi:predicted ATPase